MAATAGDTLYALGGYTGSSFEPHAEVYALDARTTSWRPVAPLPAARGAMAAAALGGKLYLVGGVGHEGLANELYLYDTVADHWEERRPAPTRRDHLAAAALHGRLYLGAAVVGNVLYVIGGGTHPGLSVSGRVEVLEVH